MYLGTSEERLAVPITPAPAIPYPGASPVNAPRPTLARLSKGHLCHAELLPSARETNGPIKNWVKGVNGHFPQEDA